MSTDEYVASADARVQIEHLDIRFDTDSGEVHAVDDVNFYVEPGEILAIVGESGSGKTVTARSILGLLPETAQTNGTILLDGMNVAGLSQRRMRSVRGRKASMVFQEPSSALNPVYPVWWQMAEGLRAHDPKLGRRELRARVVEALTLVGIPNPEKRLDDYPHEFSGGQKQRIIIAMALALGAELIIADEPTTALDVTVQAEILQLLRDIRDTHGTSIILITHNMGVVADLADSVLVMYRGKVVERKWVRELFANPEHPYTRQLLAAVPRIGTKSASRDLSAEHLARVQASEPVVVAKGMEVTYPGRLGSPAFRAVKGVDFTIHAGEVLGLVGESGSGKTTIGRAMAGLESVTGGSLSVLGHEMRGFRERAFKPLRKQIGFVFQDPATSFDPQLTIGECIEEPIVVHSKDLSAAQRRERVEKMLEAVELPREYARRFPHELSGGQRQRVSFARALVLEPTLLIADEPTSALDVSVQATVLQLFTELQHRFGFASLFISHDLAVVDMLAHRVGVLYQGQLVELDTGDKVMSNPDDAYTQRLLASLPVPDPVEQAERRQRLRQVR